MHISWKAIAIAAVIVLALPYAVPLLAASGDPIGTGTATLSWQPPTQNENGTPATDVVGYRLYWLATPNTRPTSCKSPPGYVGINYAPACPAYYSNSTNVSGGVLTTPLTFQLSGPTRIAFAVTAVDAAGHESGYSNEASKTFTVAIIDDTPMPPTGLTVQFNGVSCSIEGHPELTCTFTSD
jgi:hypothetical protein